MESPKFTAFNHEGTDHSDTSTSHDISAQSESINNQLPDQWVGGNEASPSDCSTAAFGSNNGTLYATDMSLAPSNPPWEQPMDNTIDYALIHGLDLAEFIGTLSEPVNIPQKADAVDQSISFLSMTPHVPAPVNSSVTVLSENRAPGHLSDVSNLLPSVTCLGNPFMPEASGEASTSTSATTDDAIVLEDALATIGIVLQNGKFRCNRLECADKTYNRPAELKRHHNTTHATRKPEFWCVIPSCKRSAAMRGGRPFPREDKLRDHVQKVHVRKTS